MLDASAAMPLMMGIADGINTKGLYFRERGEPARLAHRDYEGRWLPSPPGLEKRNLMSSVALIGHRILRTGKSLQRVDLIGRGDRADPTGFPTGATA